MKEIENLLHDLLVDLSMGETKGTPFIDKWKKEILSLLPDISSLEKEKEEALRMVHNCMIANKLKGKTDPKFWDEVEKWIAEKLDIDLDV